MSREEKRGWLSSVMVHLVLAVILFAVKVDETKTAPEFLEVSWENLSSTPVPMVRSSSKTSSSAPSSAGISVKREERIRKTPVNLPERSPGFDAQDPPLPPSRKSAVEEEYVPAGKTGSSEAARGKKTTGSGLGDQEKQLAVNGSGGSGKTPGLSGGDGTDVGKSVGYSMQWGDGGTRRLIAGDLPEYPEGVSVETQIRVEAVVTPAGKVRTVRPIQKGNKRLEDAALNQVRKWLFEPLGAGVRQVDQTCNITFNFVLR
jgi:TonB family protein